HFDSTLALRLPVRRPPSHPPFPYTTLFRSLGAGVECAVDHRPDDAALGHEALALPSPPQAEDLLVEVENVTKHFPIGGEQVLSLDRKSTRLNSSHCPISYSLFFFKKQSRPS